MEQKITGPSVNGPASSNRVRESYIHHTVFFKYVASVDLFDKFEEADQEQRQNDKEPEHTEEAVAKVKHSTNLSILLAMAIFNRSLIRQSVVINDNILIAGTCIPDRAKARLRSHQMDTFQQRSFFKAHLEPFQ